jgi:biotin carboxyl carrier protein
MLQITVNENRAFSVGREGDNWQIDGVNVDGDIQLQPNGLISILFNNKSYTATIEEIDHKAKQMVVSINGSLRSIAISEPMDQLLASMGLDLKALQKVEPIKAPMPGMVLKVLVQPGQQIAKGDGLLILEAMKMENVLKASADATVKSINVQERTAVEKGTVLIELE